MRDNINNGIDNRFRVSGDNNIIQIHNEKKDRFLQLPSQGEAIPEQPEISDIATKYSSLYPSPYIVPFSNVSPQISGSQEQPDIRPLKTTFVQQSSAIPFRSDRIDVPTSIQDFTQSYEKTPVPDTVIPTKPFPLPDPIPLPEPTQPQKPTAPQKPDRRPPLFPVPEPEPSRPSIDFNLTFEPDPLYPVEEPEKPLKEASPYFDLSLEPDPLYPAESPIPSSISPTETVRDVIEKEKSQLSQPRYSVRRNKNKNKNRQYDLYSGQTKLRTLDFRNAEDENLYESIKGFKYKLEEYNPADFELREVKKKGRTSYVVYKDGEEEQKLNLQTKRDKDIYERLRGIKYQSPRKANRQVDENINREQGFA